MGRELNGGGAGGAAPRRVLVVAGEPSGDLHAARLVRALRTLGEVDVRGVAGPLMRAEGVQALVPQEDLAVIGFSGILAKLPALFATRDRLLREMASFRPHAVVLVDYPGFNLRLGPSLRAAGARIFYYIGPQVWAWHPERAAAMSRWVERLAVVFPFEEPIFREAGVATTFVGHPLLDELVPEADAPSLRAELGVPADARLVGLLPGSRPGELAQHGAAMVAAGGRLAARFPGVHAVVALAGGRDRNELPRDLPRGVSVVRDRTRAVQAYSECCAVASGTATLETALFGTPLVVCYRVGRINYAIARRLVKLPHIGLPNIVAGREVAPELVQDAFTVDALEARLAAFLADAGAARAAREALAGVRTRLGGPGASERTARALWEMLA